MNGGDKKGFFSDLNGVVKNYWPGGNGVAGMCGCGLTKTCAEPDKNVRLLKSQKICHNIWRIFWNCVWPFKWDFQLDYYQMKEILWYLNIVIYILKNDKTYGNLLM